MDTTESRVDFVTTYEPAFRRHYQLTYYDTGRAYEEYEPGYCLGYELVTIHGLGNRTWAGVEREAWRQWESQHRDLSWQEVKGAVEHGWNEAREGLGLQDYARYDEAFRAHHAEAHATTGHAYDDYAPAYRYGYELAYDERYARRLWPSIEPEIRKIWSATHDTPWNSVKDAIEYAWNRVRGPLDVAHEQLETYDDTFRAHHAANYATGRPYEYYAPAYRFGYHLAYDERYRDRPWEEIEPAVQREWERAGREAPWDDVKGAVHHAWREVQQAFALQEA